ncbi:MAG: FkbM family methyltransferase [Nitrospira sp.]|nr:FkbM family methyltransferase [Nitrospira sp.]
MRGLSVAKASLQVLRDVAARFPRSWQSELKRLHYRHRIRRGTFCSDEPEFSILSRFVTNGDWVVDIGANVGFYTKRLAELVGSEGRVLAFEPVPETFVLLASNTALCGFTNVTLFNTAVSEETKLVGISIPDYSNTSQLNYYQAHLTSSADSNLRILTVSLDSIQIPEKVKLIKIDAEGHEYSVLKGMRNTLLRDHPILIIEAPHGETRELLESLGYISTALPESPNVVFHSKDVQWEDLKKS